MNRLPDIALLVALLLGEPAVAEHLRLTGDSWPPFTDQNLPNNGLAVDLVSSALQRAGHTTEYVEVPWARVLRGLQQGDYDRLREAVQGRLHQSARSSLVPLLSEALSLEDPDVLGAFLSGAGPSVALLARAGDTQVATTHVHKVDVTRYTVGGAIAVGLLHGIGAETGSQALVLVSASHIASTGFGLAVLGAFVAGIVVTTGGLAVGAAYGWKVISRSSKSFVVLTISTALVSGTIGALFVLGAGDRLPGILS